MIVAGHASEIRKRFVVRACLYLEGLGSSIDIGVDAHGLGPTLED